MGFLYSRHDRLCREGTLLHGRSGPGRFTADDLTYDATLRNLELIGEAATRLPDPVREAHSHIPWRMIIATRNRLIHGYLIDDDTVWSIIQDNIPELLNQLRDIERIDSDG